MISFNDVVDKVKATHNRLYLIDSNLNDLGDKLRMFQSDGVLSDEQMADLYEELTEMKRLLDEVRYGI